MGPGYRVRYRGPLGKQHSRSFSRKADADRFAREVEVDKERGNWLDPRDADIALTSWAETFLSLARRLSATTQQTYRRDLNRYVALAPRVDRFAEPVVTCRSAGRR